jgi:hypothetical protein
MQCDRNLGHRLQPQIWSTRASSLESLDLIWQPEEQPILAVDCRGLDLGEDRDFRCAGRSAGGRDETSHFDLGFRVLESPGTCSTPSPCRRTPAGDSHTPTQQAVCLQRFPDTNHRGLIRPNRYGSVGWPGNFRCGIHDRWRGDAGARLTDRGRTPRILGLPASWTAGTQVANQSESRDDACRCTPGTGSMTTRHAGSCAS